MASLPPSPRYVSKPLIAIGLRKLTTAWRTDIKLILTEPRPKSAHLQNKEETHSNIFAPEDLQDTEEDIPLESSGKGVQVLGMLAIRVTGSVCGV